LWLSGTAGVVPFPKSPGEHWWKWGGAWRAIGVISPSMAEKWLAAAVRSLRLRCAQRRDAMLLGSHLAWSKRSTTWKDSIKGSIKGSITRRLFEPRNL